MLAFPSNEFGKQEPGTPAEIREFVQKTYGAKFPIFEKLATRRGKGQHPIYAFLTAAHDEPNWNFTKFVVGRDGSVLRRFAPNVTPEDARLRAEIDAALARKP